MHNRFFEVAGSKRQPIKHIVEDFVIEVLKNLIKNYKNF